MAKIPVISCKKPSLSIPRWAHLERTVFQKMDEALDIILEKYLTADGKSLWPTFPPEHGPVGAADDVYESFHSWPLFYLLGGADRFLPLSHREFDAVTEQMAQYPDSIDQEFFAWCDWMHIGEGLNFFYMLNLADPENAKNRERSLRFAGFYTGTDPDFGDKNYDPVHKVMRGSVTGAYGAKKQDKPTDCFLYNPRDPGVWFAYYNLPYYDIPGVQNWIDLTDPEKARLMGEAYETKFHAGDSPTNLLATSLMMNAYLHTGDDAYKNWVLDYAGTWRRLTAENGGIIPDNCGPGGKMGECMDGKWYGGYYGWTFPHGFMFIAEGIAVAAENETLLTGDRTKLQWLTDQTEKLLEKKIEVDGSVFVPYKYTADGADIQYIGVDTEVMTAPSTVPSRPDFRRRLQKDGWFEYRRLDPSHLTHAWFANFRARDREILWETRDMRFHGWEQIDTSVLDKFESYPMECAYGFDNGAKNLGGQEMGLMGYHMGTFPDYPETILTHNLDQMYFRLARMQTDPQPPETYADYYLQVRNPISVEGLVHLTMGGPLPLYNGGLLLVSLMYFDPEKQRPGLPEDTAALISRIADESLTLELVNLSPTKPRRVIVQGGAYGEHTIETVTLEGERTPVGGSRFEAELTPGSHTVLELTIQRFTNPPKYHTWEA